MTSFPTAVQGAPQARARYAALDAARGAALAAMVVFHTAFDLDALGLATLNVDSNPYWRWFARLIAASFLALSGASLVIAHRDRIRWPQFGRRLAILIGAAALVTLATWYAMPDEFIFFGILHMIAVASVIGLLFLRLPWAITLLAGLLALAAPFYLASPIFDAPYLRWLGLGVALPSTLDYEPVLPWLAPFLIGMAACRFALPFFDESKLAHWRSLKLPWRALTFAGRNSLAIYLIHQPIIYGGLALAAELMVSTPVVPVQDRPFIDACQSTCLARGGTGAGCARYCGCTAHELKSAGMWASVLKDQLNEEERARLHVVMQSCATANQTGKP